MVGERLRRKVRMTVDVTIQRWDRAKIITDQEAEEVKREHVLELFDTSPYDYEITVKERLPDSDLHPNSMDYLEDQERCPYCRKLSVCRDPDLFDHEHGRVPCRCLMCGKQWDEEWDLRGISER